jgi:hypothetical protein
MNSVLLLFNKHTWTHGPTLIKISEPLFNKTAQRMWKQAFVKGQKIVHLFIAVIPQAGVQRFLTGTCW